MSFGSQLRLTLVKVPILMFPPISPCISSYFIRSSRWALHIERI